MKRIPTLGLAVGLALGTGATGLGFGAFGSGPAGADTALGGFTVSALADASTATYEQPNAPVPATPTLEMDQGYASTTDNYGPTGSATAATVYPGQVIANAGPDDGDFAPGVPLPPAPTWPVQAASSFPATPNTDSDDQPGVTMTATSSGDSNTATSTVGPSTSSSGSGGLPGLPALPAIPALPATTGGTASTSDGSTSDVGDVQAETGTSSSGASGSTATATASAIDSGISMLGGVISIGSVTTTATATSDGTTGKVSGSTTVGNASIGGQAVTIDGSGVHAAGQSSPSAAQGTTAVDKILNTLGITMTVTNPTDTVQGAAASRTTDGLRIQIDLTTLDQGASTLTKYIPPTVIAKLPVPPPDKQILVWDMGTVTVASTASPGYDTGTGSGGSGSGANGAAAGSGPGADDLGTDGDSGNDTFGDGSSDSGLGGDTGGTAGTSGTPGTPGTHSGSGSGSPLHTQRTAAVTPLFTGIGGGLIVAGVLGALGLAYASQRANSAAEALAGDGSACEFEDGEDDGLGGITDGDPLGAGGPEEMS